MKFRSTLPALLVGLCSSCFGAAPDNLDGYVYYESGRTSARTFFDFAATFSIGRDYTELYRRSGSVAISNGVPDRLGAPNAGTFVYRKIDGTTAELTLQNSTVSGKRTLRFTADSSGGVTFESTAGLVGNFRLAPLAALSPLLACSNRSFVAANAPAFAGFVITGEVARVVVVRAVGPGLAPFGITNFLRNPALVVTRSRDNLMVGTNDDWSSESAESVTSTTAVAGTFPLPVASKDSVVILNLTAGAYVAQVTSPDAGDSGQALIEVYILP
jgi:hypothetical protein